MNKFEDKGKWWYCDCYGPDCMKLSIEKNPDIDGHYVVGFDPIVSDLDIDKTLDDIPIGVLIEEYKKRPLAVYKNKPSLKEAIEILCNELKDEDYYRSWSANIAMAFKDEFFRCDPNLVVDHLRVHDIANNAADNFLKQLIK